MIEWSKVILMAEELQISVGPEWGNDALPLVQVGIIRCADSKMHVRMTMPFFKRRTSLISIHPHSPGSLSGTLS